MAIKSLEGLIENFGSLKRRRHKPFWRFRLSTLLAAMTVACLLCLPVMLFVRRLRGALAWRAPLLLSHLRAEYAVDIVPWICGVVAGACAAIAALTVFALPARRSFRCLCAFVVVSPVLLAVGMGLGGPPDWKVLKKLSAREYWSVQLTHLGVGLPLGALLGWRGRDARDASEL